MAKDAGKINVTPTGNCNNENTSLSDKQKVPPLRIVLNTSGAQKSSGSQNNQQQDLSKSSTQDYSTLKGSGKLRSKLGTGSKQNLNASKQTKDSTDPQNSSSKEGNEPALQKASKGTSELKESGTSAQKEEQQHTSHLRRITRRSQRAAQLLTNEDDESMTSMTSIDDNANANDNTDGLETSQGLPNSNANQASNPASGSSETPKRHKRRKLETSESLSEYDGLFNYQNYRLPMHNSFELFKNIRKQIDEKLKGMTAVHPRTPYGFKDYMLTKGAYLLDGNRLGNGTNLFMNEDGGLHLAPITKYHVLRTNRLNYSVPNRAKVPLGLPISSPLYNLFIDQEKERYKMRIQHIKEREKLTLATEQEIVRVYSQAAMAAANQSEPLSACTMLMHQEIYNSMDADSPTNPNEDEAINETETNSRYPDRVRTRRRNAAAASSSTHNSPHQIKENCNENQAASRSLINAVTNPEKVDIAGDTKQDQLNASQDSEEKTELASNKDEIVNETISINENHVDSRKKASIKVESPEKIDGDSPREESSKTSTGAQMILGKTDDSVSKDKDANLKKLQSEIVEGAKTTTVLDKSKDVTPQSDDNSKSDPPRATNKKADISDRNSAERGVEDSNRMKFNDGHKHDAQKSEATSSNVSTEIKAAPATCPKESDVLRSEGSNESLEANDESEPKSKAPDIIEKEEKEAQEQKFLEQLQDIDDKWEKIRKEMLTRHINEADSLHSIQKLEWEWKTKEIGFCDVRTTPVIDDTLVPKLKIHPQDY